MIESSYSCSSYPESMFASCEDIQGLTTGSSVLDLMYSAWDGDCNSEYLLTYMRSTADNGLSPFEINSIDDKEELLEFKPKENFPPDCLDFENVLNDSSTHSSDYDSVFGDIEKLLPVPDSLISNVFEDCSTGFPNEWSVIPQDVENHTSPLQNTSTAVRNSKKPEKILSSLSKKSWSKMSTEEQLETLHSLSKMVTCHMDFREQIKVIKIIDPAATISPNDTEFQLDISRLNDTKLKRIVNLLRKHRSFISDSKRIKCFSKISQQKTADYRSKDFSRRTSPKTKKIQRKEKSSTDNDDLQKRKLKLHGIKEIQSGLFVYEKVIKLSNPLEDEDVNILE